MTEPGPMDPSWPASLVGRGEPHDDRRRELFRLAANARRIIGSLVSTSASIEQLTAAADRLDEVAAVFDSLPSGSMYEGFAESANQGDRPGFLDHSPLLGLANPLAPPLQIDEVGERTLRASVTFGAAYEGPPGCVHGGFIAAAFDEVLGSVQSLSGQPGMTGRLSVSYRSPTPLHERLVFDAAFDRIEGRKVFTDARLFAGERLCAEAEGLFISIDFSRFAELKARRDQG